MTVTLKLKSSMIIGIIGSDVVNVVDAGDIKIGNVGTMIVGIIGSDDENVGDAGDRKSTTSVQ